MEPRSLRGEKALRLPEVVERTGLKRPTIYKRARAGTFPKPIKLGPNSSAWLESEVDAWLSERIAARNHGGAA